MFSAKFSWAEKEKYLFIFHENKQKQLLGNKVATRILRRYYQNTISALWFWRSDLDPNHHHLAPSGKTDGFNQSCFLLPERGRGFCSSHSLVLVQGTCSRQKIEGIFGRGKRKKQSHRQTVNKVCVHLLF